MWFGGVGNADNVLNSAYILELDTMKWKLISFGKDNQPPPMAYMTATKICNKVWFFGGQSPVRNRPPVLYLDLKTMKWHYPQISGDEIIYRKKHIACGFERLSKIVFYGRQIRENSDTISVLDTETLTMKNYTPKNSPPYRLFCGSAAVPNHNKFIIYGGRTESAVLGDIWIFDLDRMDWNEIKQNPDKKKPKDRAGHTLTLLNLDNLPDSVYKYAVFGGWDGSRNNNTEVGAENDLWILTLNIDTYEYNWEEIVLDNPPVPRDCHTAVHTVNPDFSGNKFQNYLVVYGGSDPDFKHLTHLSICNLDGIFQPPPLTSIISRSYLLEKSSQEITDIFPKLPPSIADLLIADLNFLYRKYSHTQIDKIMELYCQFVKIFATEDTNVEFRELTFETRLRQSPEEFSSTSEISDRACIILKVIEELQNNKPS
jgi:hypothetical protein